MVGSLPEIRRGIRYIIAISGPFAKLVQGVSLRHTRLVDVAQAFSEYLVYKYGPPKTLLLNNENQSASEFVQTVYQLLAMVSVFTSTYHPQANWPLERYDQTLAAMLRGNANDNQQSRDDYDSTLKYTYNSQACRSTNTRAFDLVLNRRMPDFTLHLTVFTRKVFAAAVQRVGSLPIQQHSFNRSRVSSQRTQTQYKQDFNWRLLNNLENLKTGDYVISSLLDHVTKTLKLGHAVEGSYRVL